MSTYASLNYHLVWATQNRIPCFPEETRRELHRYLYGILRSRNSHVYRIGGFDDHVHLLVGLHQTDVVADTVRVLKASSSKWIHESGTFPNFQRWQEGYGVFTVGARERAAVAEYIKNQNVHHRRVTFADEFKALIEECGLVWQESDRD